MESDLMDQIVYKLYASMTILHNSLKNKEMIYPSLKRKKEKNITPCNVLCVKIQF